VVYPIAYHSNFHPRRDHADRTAVVHVADIICRAKGIGYGGDNRIPKINREAWSLLRLTMDDVSSVCEQLDLELRDGAIG
jgi:hypothetical protein